VRFSKNILINALKMIFVALLLWWMASSGRLSWSQMAIILRRPDALAASVAVWLIGPVVLGTARWWLLMRGAGMKCGYFHAMRLQLVGFFFNTAMPGAVGGDIIKALYIMRDQSAGVGKTPAMLSVLLDRIIGLIGLFVMGVVAAGLSYKQLVANPVTAQLMNGLALVVALSAVFLGLVFVRYPGGRDPIKKILKLRLPGFLVLRRIYEALRNYRDRPGILILTIVISVLIQVMFLFFMGFIGRIMYGSDAFDQALLAPIFPFGILVTAIPLAPGGLGVGHAAFDKLFAMVGLPGGANVFNAYVLSQLLLNLLGIIPYLSMKSTISQALPGKVPVT
jgi:hypothetical protein